jgi:hypothetical protein
MKTQVIIFVLKVLTIMALIVSAGSVLGQSQPQGTPTPGPQTITIPINVPDVDQLNNQFGPNSAIEIALPGGRGRTQVQQVKTADPNAKRFYYFPLCFVSLASLRDGEKAFQELNKANANMPPKPLIVPIQIFFDTDQGPNSDYESIRQQVAKNQRITEETVTLDVVAHWWVRVFANLGADYRLLYEEPTYNQVAANQIPLLASFPTNGLPCELALSADEFEKFRKNPRLVVQYFCHNYSVQMNIVTATADTILNGNEVDSLAGDETAQDSVTLTQSTSGGGGGVNVGPISFGDSSTHTIANTAINRKRWVTRNSIMQALQSKVSKINIDAWSSQPGGSDAKAALVKTFTDMICKNNLEAVDGEFQTITQGQNTRVDLIYKDASDNVTISQTYSGNTNIKTDASNSSSVSEGGVKASESGSQSQTAGGDVNSTSSSTIFPTNVGLYLLSKATIHQAIEANSVDVQATASQALYESDNFGWCVAVSPTGFYYVSSAALGQSPTENPWETLPIGSVIANTFSFEYLCKKYPGFAESWVPCDGRIVGTVRGGDQARSAYPMAKGEELGWSPGATEGWTSAGSPQTREINPTGEVRVPDLRGLFLRGLNRFASDVPPGQVDPDVNRVAGSFQRDAFKAHTHEIIGTSSQFQGGGAATGLFWRLDPQPNNVSVWSSVGRAIVDNTPVSDNETRPKNVAVYYYIKVN